MLQVLDLVARAAGSEATVLIQGETGTGKELIARTIHRQSPRASGPFVAVNCGAYTDSLLASELFGHKRGAFTGAVTDHAGVFEAATGGTVFLDEIGAMSPAMQVKVLRVLQERVVSRVGSSDERPVDARVVAATNAELTDLVRAGQFREDLYYRIKIVTCRIPPLRVRRDDIKPLIVHYLKQFCDASAKTGIVLAPATEAELLSYDWPGNVRQLRGEIEQIVAIVEPGTVVQPYQLSEELRHRTAPATGSVGPTSPAPGSIVQPPLENAAELTYQQLLDGWTQQVLVQRLESCGGNITRTAQSLAISRSTLYALLKKYGMHGQD